MLSEHTELSREEIGARVLDALGDVQLPKREKFLSFRHELSRGQAQRAMLAAALIKGPDLLVADEPLSGLDPPVARAVLELIQDMRRKRGMAMIFVSHDLATVASIADRIGVVYGGRIIEEGDADQIFHSPQHPYTAGLLGSIPWPGVDRLRPIEGDAPPLTDLPPGCAFAPRCEFADQRCRAERPPIETAGTTLIACHHHATLELPGIRRG